MLNFTPDLQEALLLLERLMDTHFDPQKLTARHYECMDATNNIALALSAINHGYDPHRAVVVELPECGWEKDECTVHEAHCAWVNCSFCPDHEEWEFDLQPIQQFLGLPDTTINSEISN
jgi:hypothetical protein